MVSEAEILESLFSIWDRYWTIVQWWSSVSFSLIIVAYFAAARLNRAMVATLIALYVVYSFWVWILMADNQTVELGLYVDLEAVRSSIGQLSRSGEAILDNSLRVLGARLGTFAMFFTFAACIGYFVYAFRKSGSSADT
ncbi:MAG: hypothetical protein Cons2KO_31960 [Congregibacter sp.]